ncbi:MAG: DUF5011 domain-containing protein [Bacilli bacterium]|nr:DUF5011 domain-containing protein [Bacilli bacterium]
MNLKNRYFLFVFLIILFTLGIGFYFFYVSSSSYDNLISHHVYVEYGSPVTAKDVFITVPEEEFQFSPPLEEIKEVGNYLMTLSIHKKNINFEIHIIDSTEPILEVHPLTIYLDEDLPKAEDFVLRCEDLSRCSFPDVFIERKEGEQTISIIAVDDYGNQAIKETVLTMIAYSGAPLISGLNDIFVEEGNKVNLKNGVNAYDQRFGNVSFTIDDSKVNYNLPGTYEIIYTASNPLGIVTTKKRKINVRKKDVTYMINNFPTFSQYPKYPNGCETVALYNLLRFYKVSVSLDEIVDKLPKGEGPHLENAMIYGGDPEVEFVGNPRDLHGYGVFQKPIFDLANQYKGGMIDYTGHSLNDVLALVKQKIPVQVWVSIGLKDTKVCASWTHRVTGKNIDWICNLHSVIIVGYNSNTVYVSDSYTGKIESYGRKQFEKMFELFGRRALYFPN